MLSGEQVMGLRKAMGQRLAQVRDLIQQELAVEGEAKSRAGSADVGDFGDDAVGADLARTEDALIELHRAEARELEAALDRLSNGRYGLCIDCGVSIEFERLRANPTGKRCQPCQRQFELAATTTGKAR
jgi:RNA polymerase-binding transcription factor DksA